MGSLQFGARFVDGCHRVGLSLSRVVESWCHGGFDPGERRDRAVEDDTGNGVSIVRARVVCHCQERCGIKAYVPLRPGR